VRVRAHVSMLAAPLQESAGLDAGDSAQSLPLARAASLEGSASLRLASRLSGRLFTGCASNFMSNLSINPIAEEPTLEGNALRNSESAQLSATLRQAGGSGAEERGRGAARGSYTPATR
jgi:hypothetical protein